MYHAEFTGKRNVISISYEFGDDALFVIIFSTEKGELSHYDDLVSTPRLSNLNSRYMRLVSPRERIETDIAFSAITGEGKAEKLLIKSAKELRLVLPKYMAEHDASKRAT